MIGKMVAAIRRDAFLTSRRAILFHPSYLTRRALYKAVRRPAAQFRGRLLDFGCGSKPYKSLFTNVDTYLGVDVEQSGHNHTTSHIDVFYDGKRLPFDDQHFDGVVAFEVFEHVFNLPDMLAEIGRVLKPGGKIMFTVPFAWPEHEQPYDFARYTSFGMRHLLESAGYQVVSIDKSNGSVRAIAQLSIGFVNDQVVPLLGIFARPVKTAVIPLLNLAAVGLAAILPRSDEIYSNLVVQAIRP